MVKVTYDRKNLELKAEGHAKSGEAGHDLVCAAVSILVYTLASNVAQMSADHKRVRKPRLEIAEGNACISCRPVHGMQALTTLIFDSICSGFDILEAKFPDNISYTVVEG